MAKVATKKGSNGKAATRKYQVISADGHVEVPPEYWVKYVPKKWQNRAPRLVKLPEGGEGWLIEGQPLLHNGQNISGGKTIKFRNDTYYNADGSPAIGAGNAIQRLHEQDRDGIDAEVLFPPVFATRFLEGIRDKEVYLSMVQAYNTFLSQDYCSAAPDRLIGNGVIPISGIEDAVQELKRCKELGLRSVSFHQFPNGTPRPSKDDDRFWETALKLDMRLSPHAGWGDRAPALPGVSAGTGNQEVAAALFQRAIAPAMYSIEMMVVDGTFDRFPELSIYVAETNASWMPAALWFADDNYAIFGNWFKLKLKMTPSEYVRKHFWFSFIRDPMAIKLRDFLPVERLMWGSDFPHSVGSYPKSQEWLETIFEGAPESLRRKLLLENPAEFFDLDLEKPITKTPAMK